MNRSRVFELAVIVLAGTVLAACPSTNHEVKKEDGNVDTAAATFVPGQLTPHMVGRAVFLKGKGGRLQLDGTYNDGPSGTASEKLLTIQVRGVPGLSSMAASTIPSFVSHQAPHKAWDTPWVVIPWEEGQTSYTILVRTSYEKYEGGSKKKDQLDSLHHFREIKVSKTVTMTPEPDGPGGANATVAATGSFYGSQSFCLYDVEIDYTKRATMIEIWAAPASPTNEMPFPDPDDHQLVVRNTTPPMYGSGLEWAPTGLSLSYDGSDQYKMLIKITFQNGDPFLYFGRFKDLNANQGNVIPLGD